MKKLLVIIIAITTIAHSTVTAAEKEGTRSSLSPRLKRLQRVVNTIVSENIKGQSSDVMHNTAYLSLEKFKREQRQKQLAYEQERRENDSEQGWQCVFKARKTDVSEQTMLQAVFECYEQLKTANPTTYASITGHWDREAEEYDYVYIRLVSKK